MLDLYEEFRSLVESLADARASFALCGALALAVHGHVRATTDIDLLVPPEDLPLVKSVCNALGFTIEAKPMRVAGGRIEVERLTKVDSRTGDALSVDLLTVADVIRDAWTTRSSLEWEGMHVDVVSREALIAMKRLRSSSQDLHDIAWLEGRDG